MPRKREACLHLVEAPPGFVLGEETVGVWCEFPRPDLMLRSERERGLAFGERVVWKELGSVALRAATPALAVKRVLELVTHKRL